MLVLHRASIAQRLKKTHGKSLMSIYQTFLKYFVDSGIDTCLLTDYQSLVYQFSSYTSVSHFKHPPK